MYEAGKRMTSEEVIVTTPVGIPLSMLASFQLFRLTYFEEVIVDLHEIDAVGPGIEQDFVDQNVQTVRAFGQTEIHLPEFGLN